MAQERGQTQGRGGRFKGPGKGRGPAGARRKKNAEFGMRFRRKVCRFCEEKLEGLDYKDVRRLERLVSERGKILSRRLTGSCARHQRMVQQAVKRARYMALLPYMKK
ncbi:MAG: 30S ribosomal protein S18 [Deltaproteobacteria bacterium]